MQHYNGPERAFRSNEAIGLYLRVTVTAVNGEPRTEVAGATDIDVGVQWEESFGAGEVKTVLLNNGGGTQKVVASGSVSIGANVYTAANGKVSASQGSGYLRGIALDAASADNDVIEILPIVGEVAGS